MQEPMDCLQQSRPRREHRRTRILLCSTITSEMPSKATAMEKAKASPLGRQARKVVSSQE